MTGGKHYKEELFFKTGFRYREPQRWDDYLIEAEESAQRNLGQSNYSFYNSLADENEEMEDSTSASKR